MFDSSRVNGLSGSRIDALRGFDTSVSTIQAGATISSINTFGASVVTNRSDNQVGGAIVTNDNSQLNLSAGIYTGSLFQSLGTSTVNISGGEYRRNLDATDASEMNLSGGTFTNTVDVFDDAELFVTGGTFTRNGIPLRTFGNAVANISDGSFIPSGNNTAFLLSTDTSEININGGIFEGGLRADQDARINIFGGEIGDLLAGTRDVVARNDSVITIFGSEFNLPFGDIVAESGLLTGLLLDGTAIEADFLRFDATGSRIILAPAPVPLPAAIWLFGSGAIVLITCSRRRRRSVGEFDY